MNVEAEDDENEAGELRLPLGSSTPPIAAAPAPSRTKTTVKPPMKGRLASATRRAAPGCAQLVGFDRGDRREVARDERQHAGRDHRDEPREERQRDAL